MDNDLVVERRRQERALQQRGFLRCTTYLGNLARMNDLPVVTGPGLRDNEESDWIPAWLEWHLQRYENSALSHISQRERLQEAKKLLEDKPAQLLLLCEVQLTGCTIYDPGADLSTQEAIKRLKEELQLP